MSQELNILKHVCVRLEQLAIPYMLTGSFAANFYAVPRMTRDIDIVIEILNSNVKQICQIFENDFYVDENSIFDAIENKGMFNIIHNDSVLKIDFIVRKTTLYRKLEFQRKQQILLPDGTPIWIVSPEDLILSKLAWAKDSSSKMQLNDVKNLLNSIENLDNVYIEEWVDNLNLGIIYEKIEGGTS